MIISILYVKVLSRHVLTYSLNALLLEQNMVWGLKSNNAPVNLCEDIIKVLIEPTKHGMYEQQHSKEEILKLSLYMAFTLDSI